MEQQLLFLINRQWTSGGLDLFMAAISSFDIWKLPAVVLGICLLIFGGFKGRAFVLIAGLLVGLSDGVVAQSFKKIVQRPRPHEVLANVRQVDLRKATPRLLALFKKPKVKLSHPEPGERGGNSFPSGHTMNNFCMAAVVSTFYRRGWLYFFVAACVGYSRIYVGSHWPSDVLASSFIGCGLALLCLPLAEWAWRKLAPRYLPRVFTANPSLFGETVA